MIIVSINAPLETIQHFLIRPILSKIFQLLVLADQTIHPVQSYLYITQYIVVPCNANALFQERLQKAFRVKSWTCGAKEPREIYYKILRGVYHCGETTKSINTRSSYFSFNLLRGCKGERGSWKLRVKDENSAGKRVKLKYPVSNLKFLEINIPFLRRWSARVCVVERTRRRNSSPSEC